MIAGGGATGAGAVSVGLGARKVVAVGSAAKVVGVGGSGVGTTVFVAGSGVEVTTTIMMTGVLVGPVVGVLGTTVGGLSPQADRMSRSTSMMHDSKAEAANFTRYMMALPIIQEQVRYYSRLL